MPLQSLEEKYCGLLSRTSHINPNTNKRVFRTTVLPLRDGEFGMESDFEEFYTSAFESTSPKYSKTFKVEERKFCIIGNKINFDENWKEVKNWD